MKRRKILLLAAVILFICAMPCETKAVTVKKNKKTIYLKKNQIKKLKIKGYSKLPNWKSKNINIVKPINKGYIQGIASGKTWISAKAGKKTWKCQIVVMELDQKSLFLKKGTSQIIKVKKGGSKIKWKTSNKSVATVSGGKIKAKGTGTAIITATAHDKSFTCKVTVPEVTISAISLVASPPEPGSIKASKSTARITVKNNTGTPLYSSGNPEVASVSADGTVTALKAGTALITVSVNGLVYSETIKVSDRPVDIYLTYLKKYNKFIKANGQYFKRNDTPEETYQEAKKLVESKKTARINCRAHACWAFHDMGITPYVIYAKTGTFSSRFKGTMITYLTRITTGGPIGKTYKQAVDAGLLKPGDICAFQGKTHTFTYSGDGYKFYDGGTVVELTGYAKVGICIDYSSVKYYKDNKIGEILRWNY